MPETLQESRLKFQLIRLELVTFLIAMNNPWQELLKRERAHSGLQFVMLQTSMAGMVWLQKYETAHHLVFKVMIQTNAGPQLTWSSVTQPMKVSPTLRVGLPISINLIEENPSQTYSCFVSRVILVPIRLTTNIINSLQGDLTLHLKREFCLVFWWHCVYLFLSGTPFSLQEHENIHTFLLEACAQGWHIFSIGGHPPWGQHADTRAS